MAERVCASAVIFGRVQGVAFRFETQRCAAQLGVHGWVRNRWDGAVEAVFEGERPQVEKMLDWCRRGPELSWVQNVEVSWQEPSGEFTDFRIRR